MTAAEVSGSHFARVKRFRERWTADDAFRAAVAVDPSAEAARFGLEADGMAALWTAGRFVDASTAEGRALQRLDAASQAYLDFTADDSGAPESYIAWRARQKARAALGQGYVVAPLGLHLPFTVELTKGCSVGCWFCGLSADSLEAALPTDLDSWAGMLRALRGVFGASAVRGFLYWATDPLDHPDYESYCEVFRRELGVFPVTTTAMPLADPARTRRLLELSRAGGSPSMRFSVISKRQLDDIHAEFSADELADVDLVMVNRESILGLAQAGRLREKAQRRPERAALERRKLSDRDDDEVFSHRTIACVSGFLIEPVIGRVRLISPEPCSDRWPDGYAVFDEARFDGPEEFGAAVRDMARRNMTAEPPDRLALMRGVQVSQTGPNVVRAEARGVWVDFRAHRPIGHLPALAEAFRGGAGVDAAAARIAGRFKLDPALARKDAVELWRKGVLIETFFDLADADGPGRAAEAPAALAGAAP